MERSVVVRIIFLESRNFQFLWDLIESVLANAEHLGLQVVVTVWTWRTRGFLCYPNFKLELTNQTKNLELLVIGAYSDRVYVSLYVGITLVWGSYLTNIAICSPD